MSIIARQGHSSPISGISSYGGEYIATASYDNSLILWDAASKSPIARAWHDHLVNNCSFSPCGGYLLTASSDYTARLWRTPSLELLAVFGHHEDDVEHAAFSPDGNFIATASRDHRVRIFDREGNLLRTMAGHTADVLCVSWINEGEEIVSSGDDGTIRIWDAATGALKFTYASDGAETDTCAVFGPYIFAGNDEGEIKVADNRRNRWVDSFKAHDAGIKCIKTDTAGKLLVSSSYDGTVKVWDINEDGALQLRNCIVCQPDVWLRALKLVSSSVLAFGTFGSAYATYDLEDDKWDFSGVNDTPGINAVAVINGDIITIGDAGKVRANEALTADCGSLCNFLLQAGDIIITGGQAGVIFNALTGEAIYKHHSPINCGACFRYEGDTYVVAGAYTGEGIVLKMEDGNLVFNGCIKLHSNAVKGITSDGTFIFSVCANKDAALHRVPGLELEMFRKGAHGLIANGADCISQGIFVSVSRDRKLRIWDSEQNCQVIDTPHTHSVKCVKVSGGTDKYIATGSYSGMVCIYDLGRNRWAFAKKLSASGISSLAYCDSRMGFVATCYGGKVYAIEEQEYAGASALLLTEQGAGPDW